MKRSDTTVKLDGSLVEEVSSDLKPGETLTAYVRKAVRYRVRSSRMRKAAEAYRAAMRADPGLVQELEDWERADLAKAPARQGHAQPE